VEDADEPVREGAQGLVVGRALTQRLRAKGDRIDRLHRSRIGKPIGRGTTTNNAPDLLTLIEIA
jgi:hypothetical protein